MKQRNSHELGYMYASGPVYTTMQCNHCGSAMMGVFPYGIDLNIRRFQCPECTKNTMVDCPEIFQEYDFQDFQEKEDYGS